VASINVVEFLVVKTFIFLYYRITEREYDY